jgi:hypothetical protein
MAGPKKDASPSSKRRPPAITPEALESQVIADAYKLADKQIREGTASSQVITHFLKLGSSRERIEKDILASKRELIQAQTESIISQKKIEALYADALKAMRNYGGHDEGDDDD